jgi:hypothetical protein
MSLALPTSGSPSLTAGIIAWHVVQIKSVGKKGPYLVAFRDKERRKSKRRKDFADILRMVETHLELEDRLPPAIEPQME